MIVGATILMASLLIGAVVGFRIGTLSALVSKDQEKTTTNVVNTTQE